MKLSRAGVILLPALLFATACGSRVAVRHATADASGATQVAGNTPADEAILRQELAERDQEIARLRDEVQSARTRENAMRVSLEDASQKSASDAARSTGAAAAAGAVPGADSAATGRPDVVVAALRAALSQEQQRREVVETQLTRLKEETSAVYTEGPRVPEADYLAVKQELMQLQQTLADEREARQHVSVAAAPVPPSAAAPPEAQAAVSAESADLRVRLQKLQEEKDVVVETLNRNLATSQQRVSELEQQLEASRAAPAPVHVEAAAPPPPEVTAANANLRVQLDDERRRAEDLAAKLKTAARVNDLIFKIQAQQANAKPAPVKRRPRKPPVTPPDMEARSEEARSEPARAADAPAEAIGTSAPLQSAEPQAPVSTVNPVAEQAPVVRAVSGQ